jgi:hypothetical protein
MATLLISRAQSCWSQSQWSDASLHSKVKARSGGSVDSSHTSAAKKGDVARRSFVSPFLAHKTKYFLSLSSANSSSQNVVLFVR